MIKASLNYHDPIEIYDSLKNEYGALSMLIKGNSAIITFENMAVKKQILENPKKMIGGLPLTFKAFQEQQPNKKIEDGRISLTRLLSNEMDVENEKEGQQDLLMLGESIYLPNNSQRLRMIHATYQAKIKEIKSAIIDEQTCGRRITALHNTISAYIKNNKNLFADPYKNLEGRIKQFMARSEDNQVDLEQTFVTNPNKYSKKIFNYETLPYYIEGINYLNHDVSSFKRLCSLNETDFITTLKLKSSNKNDKSGQLRIYRKGEFAPQFSIDIQEGPYSLMMYQNFILTGDYYGHIHFIDIENQNICEYSNKLNQGLIVQMLNFDQIGSSSSMLTLLSGLRNDYKIKLFDIQKQKVNDNTSTLTFHPKQEMICEGITMSVQALGDGKFAYGCGRNTYICPSFNKSQRSIVLHDQNVMKIRKRNANELVEATQSKIFSLDLRTKVKTEVYEFKFDINTFELLSDNYVFYGGKEGHLGVIDYRKTNALIWSPAQKIHHGRISDILKVGEDVVTADHCGGIFEWKKQEIK